MARVAGPNRSFEVGLPDAMETALPKGAHVPPYQMVATPPGLASLFMACRNLYPDQPNPLQVTALVKYWLGGPDPLDYISMYSNPGDPLIDSPAHWHYISFGLSDLHGDGRVHERNLGEDAHAKPSGFGFELSFRLKRNEEESPPTWPAAVMQALARYVFKYRNLFCLGDHISWNCPIDGADSKLHHFLLAEDSQLGVVQSPYGTVQILQLVGITRDELEAVQHWNGPPLLSIIRRVAGCGGDWLVTDCARSSIFDCDPTAKADVDAGIQRDGSNLSGVSAQCCWCEMDLLPVLGRASLLANSVNMASVDASNASADNKPKSGIDVLTGSMSSMSISAARNTNAGSEKPHKDGTMRSISIEESEEIRNILRKGLSSSSMEVARRKKGTGVSMERSGEFMGGNLESTTKSLEFIHSKFLDGVHLCFNLEAGNLLPLAIRGRVMHGRHFTFQSVTMDNESSNVVGGNVITFVSEKVKGTWASNSNPYSSRGTWLHVLLKPELAEKMLLDITAALAAGPDLMLPKTLEWPEERLTITLMPDER